MSKIAQVAKWSFIVALASFATACVVEPHEGYWDRDHARYYHEHAWHPCNPGNDFCH